MNRISPRFRAALFLISLGVLIAAHLGIGEIRTDAQDRPIEPRKATFAQFSRADGVTRAVRDRANELIRVDFKSIQDRDKAAAYGTIVEEYGSFAVIAKNKGRDISRSGLMVRKIETDINLPGAKFEPIDTPQPDSVGIGQDQGRDSGYFIVQFAGPVTDAWLDSVRDAGVEVLQYVPHHAFFVHGTRAAIQKIAGHSRVRWVGAYTAEHKLSAEVIEFDRLVENEKTLVDVAVFQRADLGQIAAQIGGRRIGQSK